MLQSTLVLKNATKFFAKCEPVSRFLIDPISITYMLQSTLMLENCYKFLCKQLLIDEFFWRRKIQLAAFEKQSEGWKFAFSEGHKFSRQITMFSFFIISHFDFRRQLFS